jgi:hypothetical protein
VIVVIALFCTFTAKFGFNPYVGTFDVTDGFLLVGRDLDAITFWTGVFDTVVGTALLGGLVMLDSLGPYLARSTLEFNSTSV